MRLEVESDSDSMELCEQASICDIRKVCFTTNDSLWIHGEYRIEFNNKLLCHAKLNKWDYSNMLTRKNGTQRRELQV